MYLFHWAILVYVYNRFFATENLALKILLFIPYVFIVYIVAEISFKLYESRFLKLKDSLFTKKQSNKISQALPIQDESALLNPISNE